MASDIFDGSTVTVAGETTSGKIQDVSYSQSGPKVSVSGADATSEKYEVGVPDKECSITVVGVLSVSVGDKGATTINWNDGTSDSIGDTVVVSVETSGSKGSAITTSVTVAPTDS